MPLFGHVLTERLQTGLAPDIPEDLYMLIKKVSLSTLLPRLSITSPGHITATQSALLRYWCLTCLYFPRLGSLTSRVHQAVAVRKHLERNRKDKDSKFRLILIESRIHRLARYYKTVGVLPPTWRYEAATASTMVS